MNINQYLDAKDHNSKIIKHCLETRTNDYSDIIFWEGVRGSSLGFDELNARWADVLGCVTIGAIPSSTIRGCDGYLYWDNKGVSEVETKVSGIRQNELAVGSRGGLYYSTNLENWNSKSVVPSRLAGKFDVNMSDATMKSKKRDTFLISFDKTENKVIDAHVLRPGEVGSILAERRNNLSLTIKLNTFQNYGGRMETQWPVEGYRAWESRMIRQTKAAGRFIIY